MILKVLLPDFLNEFLIKVDPDSEFQHLKDANMFLAEDRILCMGLHTKGYNLLYLPDAFSEVDPIKSLHSLFGQRKRWINGSFFAFEKVKDDLSEHERRGNLCEWYMHLQMLYLTFSNAVSYFSPSFFLFTVHMSMVAFEADALSSIINPVLFGLESSHKIPFFIETIDFIYVMFLLAVVYFSLNLTYNQKRFKHLLYFASTVFGILSLIVFVVLVKDLFMGFIHGTTCNQSPIQSRRSTTLPKRRRTRQQS
jgi:chitin synthase